MEVEVLTEIRTTQGKLQYTALRHKGFLLWVGNPTVPDWDASDRPIPVKITEQYGATRVSEVFVGTMKEAESWGLELIDKLAFIDSRREPPLLISWLDSLNNS